VADCRLDFGLDAAQTRVLAVFMLVLGLMLCINPMLFFCQVRDMCKADKVVAPSTTPLLSWPLTWCLAAAQAWT